MRGRSTDLPERAAQAAFPVSERRDFRDGKGDRVWLIGRRGRRLVPLGQHRTRTAATYARLPFAAVDVLKKGLLSWAEAPPAPTFVVVTVGPQLLDPLHRNQRSQDCSSSPNADARLPRASSIVFG
jgi:hypothetical protein